MYMGVFGLSWQEKLRDAMNSLLALRKIIVTTDTVNTLYTLYKTGLKSGLVPGNSSAFIALYNKAGILPDIAAAFNQKLNELYRNGQLSIEVYDPEKAATVTTKAAGKIEGYVKNFMIIAALGVSAYMLSQIKSFIPSKRSG